MMNVRVFLVIAALVLAFATLAAACGGDDSGSSLEEYFEENKRIADEADAGAEALLAELVEESDTDEEQLEQIKTFSIGSLAVYQDSLDSLDEIDPPAQVKDEHKKWVEALRNVEVAYERLVNRMEEAQSSSEAVAEFESFGLDLSDAAERVTEACFDLEDIAQANGIPFDLECELEE